MITVTFTTPEPEGAFASMDVGLVIVNESAEVPPKRTAVASPRLLPVIVTNVPPDGGPLVGLIAVTFGLLM